MKRSYKVLFRRSYHSVQKDPLSSSHSPNSCLISLCCFQVGHEPLPPTVGTTMFGRRVLYLPGFFSYGEWGEINHCRIISSNIFMFLNILKSNCWWEINLFSAQHIVKVDGKTGLFRGLSPRIASSVISTVVRGKVRQVKLYTGLKHFVFWRCISFNP